MIIIDTTEAAREQYVSEVQQLVQDQLEVLFTMVTAGAARVSSGAQHIVVTRQARSLTASTGARTAVFRIEAITDPRKDLGVAVRFSTAQARCILPSAGDGDEWDLVLQRSGPAGLLVGHAWMDAGELSPLTAMAVDSTLRSCFP
jgi:hypothetical protein